MEDEYELEPVAARSFSDDELSGQAAATATLTDRKPCPACGEMIAAKAVKCRFCGEVLDRSMAGVIGASGDVSDPAWEKVRNGLGIIYYGITVMVITGVVLAIAFMAVGGVAAARGNANEFPAGAALLMLLGGLVVIGCGIAVIVGQVKCTAAPESSGARGFAIGAVCLLIGGTTIHIVSNAARAPIAALAGNLLTFIGSVLFILFMRTVARYFGNNELSASAGRYLAFVVILIGGAMVLGFTAALTGFSAPVVLLGMGLAICELIALVWFLKLIKSLQATIDGSLGRQTIRTGMP
jgi:hypothetical protein